MKQSIVAVEDKRFFQHNGVDVRGIVRARLGGHPQQGGRRGRLDDHAAVREERLQPQRQDHRPQGARGGARVAADAAVAKDRILTAYLNTIYFGNGAYGILQASRTYFHGKSADELTLPEAALLAGIPASPRCTTRCSTPWRRSSGAGTSCSSSTSRGASARVRCGARTRRRCRSPRTSASRDARAGSVLRQYVTDQLVARYGAEKVFGGGLEVTTTSTSTSRTRHGWRSRRSCTTRTGPRPRSSRSTRARER